MTKDNNNRNNDFLLALRRTLIHLGPVFFVIIFLSSFINLRTAERKLNQFLLIQAENIPLLLEGDFHDRAVSSESIDYREELLNRSRFNSFAKNNNFAWVYTVIEKEGEIYFTAPTVTDEEADKRLRWYFYPYEDAPHEFHNALSRGKTEFISYRDQWGVYRTIILPLNSPSGNRYAACIDLKTGSYYLQVLKESAIYFFLQLIIFLLVILYISFHTSNSNLNHGINQPVLMSKKDLKNIIDRQTKNLQQMTEKEHALNIQLKNVLYTSQMGLLSFNLKTGDIAEIYNNIIPDLLGYHHSEYTMNMIWIFRNICDHDRFDEYMDIVDDFRNRRINQKTIEDNAHTADGRRVWFRLHLILQKAPEQVDDILLILAQQINDDKNKEDKLIKQAQTDSLTKLYNRTYIESVFLRQNYLIRKSDLPMVICFIDINGLKTVNDNIGHNAGDKLLQDFSEILTRCTRISDITARFGGDEFLLICPKTDVRDFNELWERILNETEIFNSSMDREYNISFSHGFRILQKNEKNTNFHMLIKEADEIMYQEKKKYKKKGISVLRDNLDSYL